MRSKKEVINEQLEELLNVANKKINEWLLYKDRLIDAMTSKPPTKPPKTPK